jgi:hypothetical protein
MDLVIASEVVLVRCYPAGSMAAWGFGKMG